MRAIRLATGLLLALLGLSPWAVARADTVGNLYGAAVPVVDRSQAATDDGVVRALGVVLVKLTGQRSVLGSPAGRSLLGRAARYVTVIGHEAEPAGGYRLRVDFDPRAVAAALRERGAVLWGEQRPRTAVWLVVEDAQGRRLVPETGWPGIAQSLAAQAEQRGIPVVAGGLAEVADRGLVEALATAPPAAVLPALVGDASPPRTGAGSAAESPLEAPRLAGVLTTVDGLAWSGRWRVVIEDIATDWENAAATPEALVADGVERAADALGAHFADPAVFGGGIARVPFTVDGIASAEDYGRVLELLRGFDLVGEIGVVRVSGAAVQFELAARGGLPALVQRLRLTPLLVPVPDRPGTYLLARGGAP
jgi:hypothetical protein